MTEYSSTSRQGLPHSRDMELLKDLIDGNGGCDDRTLAIVHVCYIEKYLSQSVQARMPGLDPKLRLKLFENDGFLRPAGAINDMAKALGILGPVDHKNVRELLKIRNKFAHNLEISSFEHDEISKLMIKIEFPNHLIGDEPGAMNSHYLNEGIRNKFNMVCWLLNGAIHNSISFSHGRSENGD